MAVHLGPAVQHSTAQYITIQYSAGPFSTTQWQRHSIMLVWHLEAGVLRLHSGLRTSPLKSAPASPPTLHLQPRQPEALAGSHSRGTGIGS